MSKVHCFAGINSTWLCMLLLLLFLNIWTLFDFNFEYINIIYTDDSKLESGGHRTNLTFKKKKKTLIYIKFKNFMIFLPLKKCVTTLNFFRSHKIKFWIKFSNKLSCRLRLQLHSIFFY